MKKALIVWGGWEGHEPWAVSEIFAAGLSEHGFEVEISSTLDSFTNKAALDALDLVVPEWTMGTIEEHQLQGVLEAVRNGTGIAGVHGGMGDSFRQETEWQLMVGGQWVSHPGGADVTYTVNIRDRSHVITEGLDDFEVTSEQYYMHVDPANHVLATTDFGDVTMPVAWTKHYGKGRVFYCSLGHVAATAAQPEVLKLVTQGMLWAAGGDGR